MNKINIFVASGNELLEERNKAIIEIHKLRKIFPALNLEIIEWETDLPPGSYQIKIRCQARMSECHDTR